MTISGSAEVSVSGFAGGSAWAMAREIAGGFILVTDRTFRPMSPAQVKQLGHEIERLLRELRGSATADEPLLELQGRQRKIQRLNTTMMVLRAFRQKTQR